MNIPGYDAWRLRGPEEAPDPVKPEKCRVCGGLGYLSCECWPGDCICGHGDEECEYCYGTGEIWPDEMDEPDDSYEYERRRDAQMDRG